VLGAACSVLSARAGCSVLRAQCSCRVLVLRVDTLGGWKLKVDERQGVTTIFPKCLADSRRSWAAAISASGMT
jgi:hypothetical protein